MRHLSFHLAFRPLPWMALGLAATFCIGQASAEELTSGEHSVHITVHEVAMLDFSDSTPLSFEVVAPSQAGGSPVVQINGSNSRRLFYTSVVNSEQPQRVIRVTHGDTVPNGLRLNLHAGPPFGLGGVGTTNSGAFSAPTQVNGSGNQVVVEAIGTGYTTTDPGEGVNLTYTLAISDLSVEIGKLRAENNTVTLTYTMSAD